jgi:hypothetical protein
MAEVAARYTPEQLATVEDYLRRTTEVLRAETAKVGKQGG